MSPCVATTTTKPAQPNFKKVNKRSHGATANKVTGRSRFKGKDRNPHVSVSGHFSVAAISGNTASQPLLTRHTAVILETKKIESVTVSIFPTSVCHEVLGLDAMILVF